MSNGGGVVREKEARLLFHGDVDGAGDLPPLPSLSS